MFYETKHLSNSGLPIFERNSEFSFPPHIHSCFEIIVVMSGRMRVTVGTESRVLSKNEAALIFPDKVHSMENIEKSEHCLCIFSASLVNYYSRQVRGSVPESAFFSVPDEYGRIFSSFCDGCDVVDAKGILYLLCGLFHSRAVYTDRVSDDNEGLLYSLLSRIESSYTGECTLKSVSKGLDYDYAYISKFFKRKTGISFNNYVNRRRTDEARRLLRTTDKSVLEIALECGYNSLRSFNRNFLQQTGDSPGKYRRKTDL